MSGECNRQFGYTRNFIRQNFMTTVRFPGATSGLTTFDLNNNRFGGSLFKRSSGIHVVTLDRAGAHSKGTPLMGYWVPQGGYCDIPIRPRGAGLVFTPDFSGCSILVDQISHDQYRVYHVEGGGNYLQSQYLSKPRHGLGLAATMTFHDYGDAAYPRGFAFLKHEDGRWWIYFQRQNGVGLSFVRNKKFQAAGAQTVRGGGRIPVADLMREVPRHGAGHSGQELAVTRNIKVQKRMLPNDELW